MTDELHNSFDTSRLGLFTDYYELLMAQGYLLAGREDERAAFDYYFRKIPFEGGYVVFAGLYFLVPVTLGLIFQLICNRH